MGRILSASKIQSRPLTMNTTDPATERGFTISQPNLKLLRNHAINLRNGQLIPSGSFQTTVADVEKLFRETLVEAFAQTAPGKPFHLLFFAHGGTVGEEDAIKQALAHIPKWNDAGIYPIFFIWETGIMTAIRDGLFGAPGTRGWSDWVNAAKDKANDVTDWTLEKTVRAGQVDHIWGKMKHYAARAAEPQSGGGWIVAKELARFLNKDDIDATRVHVHCLGHSAGAVFHSHFVPTLLDAGLSSVNSLHLLAPAVTTELFERQLLGLVGQGIGHLSLFTMDEKTELADNVIKAYRKSLLYLISRALEPDIPTPILGLEESLRADASLRALFDYPRGKAQNADLIFSPNTAGGSHGANSTTHGGFGNEPDTLNSIARRITGKSNLTPFPANFKDQVESTGTRAAEAAPAITRSTPVRRALCIGIDEYPTAPLFGCVNDARLWASTFEKLGFDSVGLMVNAQASQAGILSALEEMVVSARPGDALVIQYSGHGTQVEDLDGDETAQIRPTTSTKRSSPTTTSPAASSSTTTSVGSLTNCRRASASPCSSTAAIPAPPTRAFSLSRPPHAASSERTLPRPRPRHSGHLPANPEKRGIASRQRPRGHARGHLRCLPTDPDRQGKDGHGYFTVAATALLTSGDTPTNAAFLKLVSENFPLPPSSQLPHLHCPEIALGLPLFAIAAASTPASIRDSATATTSDARLLIETMNRYLILLDRLTSQNR